MLSFKWLQVLEYEFDPEMEEAYRSSFLKSFRKQVDNCYFNFIIVDSMFERAKYIEDFWSYAKSKGFQVRYCEYSPSFRLFILHDCQIILDFLCD